MSDPAPSIPNARLKGVTTFDDLTQDLVWPRMLRAGVLAFHPARVVLCLFAVLLVGVIFWVTRGVESTLGLGGVDLAIDPPAPLINLEDPDAARTGVGVVQLFITQPLLWLRLHPLGALIAFPLSVVVLLVTSASVARSAATEFATSRAEPIRETTRFGVARLGSLVGAVAAPVIAVWLIALVLAIAGFLLLGLPVLNVVGAVLYGIALLAGAAAVFLMFVYLLGAPLLVPAVCCDGADMLDAIQRAYSYVLAKPLRLVVYAGILAVQGAVLVGVVVAFCVAVLTFTSLTTGAWTGDQARAMVQGARGEDAATFWEATYNAGASVVRGWRSIPNTIPGAFLLSYLICASTLLYLGMRRVCDGQDMHELWSPREDRGHALGAGAVPDDNDADAE